jgi:opacity protein-like surface antigen
MKKLILAAALAVLATAAQAASVVEARRGGYNDHGPGGNYYMQQYPGPNCYSQPHPVYGWICY